MNLFAKIVVFFILVLSVGFAVSQMALYSKRVNFKQKFAEAQQKASQRQSQIEQLQAELDEKTRQFDQQTSNLQQTVSGLQRKTDNQSQQITEFERKLEAAETDVRKLSVATDKLTDTIKAKEQLIATLESKKDQLTQTTTRQADRISKLDSQLADKTDQVRQLTELKNQHEQEIADLGDKIDHYEAMLSRLAQRGVHVPAEDIKAVDGKVIKTYADTDLVVINKGEEDGVKVNYPFTIYRDSEYIAQAIVTRPDRQVCVARIQEGMVAQGKKVQEGDDATTRMAGALAPITMYEER